MASDSKKNWLSGFVAELGADWVKGGLLLLAPTVPAAIAAVNGYLRDLPLWAIITSSTVTAAAVLTIIRAALEVGHRLRVKGRLLAGSAVAMVRQKPSGAIDHLGVGLHLVNQSAQALEYKITNANLVIDGRVNQSPTWQDYSSIIVPNTVALFRVDLVPVASPRAGREYPFTYAVTFAYGPPGDLKYHLDVKLRGTFVAKSASEIGVFDSVNA